MRMRWKDYSVPIDKAAYIWGRISDALLGSLITAVGILGFYIIVGCRCFD